MAINLKRFYEGIILKLTGNTPTEDGSLHVDSADNKLKVRTSGATHKVVTHDQTETLTNKTFDADGTGNSITNIENADIKSGAAIDATKIADGSVTNAEFQYIGGLTSDAQTQISTNATNIANHLSDTTDAHAGSAITNTPSGNLAATTVQAALNELQSDVDTRATSTDLSNHTSASSSVHGVTGSVVGTSDSQALTNKTINADLNTISNIENADIKTGAAIDATKIADGSVTNSEFQYIGGLTSDAQTQLNTNATNLSNHLSDTVDAHAASAISNTPSGNLAATEVQAALNELQSDIDTRATSSALTTHTSASSGIHGITGSVVGTSDTQDLSNKSFTSNTIIKSANKLTFNNAGNTFATSLKGGANSANLDLTLPLADGSNGYVLQTNGAGQLSFVQPSSALPTLTQHSIWIGDSTNTAITVNSMVSGSDIYIKSYKSTATITIASPAVVTQSGHGLNNGDKIYFTTTGALPTGLSVNTPYSVMIVDANSYKLSTTQANLLAGTFINTSGSQSGVHSANQVGLYFQTSLLRGTFTNDDASAGMIGEYKETLINLTNYPSASGSVVSQATLALSAGDWDVWGHFVLFTTTATFGISPAIQMNIEGNVGTVGAGLNYSSGSFTFVSAGNAVGANSFWQGTISPVRVKSDGTNLYINGTTYSSTQTIRMAGFIQSWSAGTPQYALSIKARRVR